MRPEAETMALMSELVTSNARGNRMLLGAPVQDRGQFGQRTLAPSRKQQQQQQQLVQQYQDSDENENVDQLRRETEALKIKLAEYERAAAVVALASQKGLSQMTKESKSRQNQIKTSSVPTNASVREIQSDNLNNSDDE